MSVRTGLDRLIADPDHWLRGRKVALLAHGASVDRDFRLASSFLHAYCGANLLFLLGPEHGFYGHAQDMEGVEGCRDPLTGLPVLSLYGTLEQNLWPGDEALSEVDLLVVDLQDVGSRYYTFVWTALASLQTAARTKTQVLVCDRPNPINGVVVEGGGISSGYESFVGRHDVAVRHGMTIAELLTLCASELDLDVDIEVVPMQGWRRTMHFTDTALPWVLPSPNMATEQTAAVYPGMCLVEATGLSEGRGTTRPFELFGAPYIEPDRLVRAIEDVDLPGVAFRPTFFKPSFHKHAAKTCGGVQVHIRDRAQFQPYRTAVALLMAVKRLWPQQFAWRTEPYEFVSDRLAVDLLSGSDVLRQTIDGGGTLFDLEDAWSRYEIEFRRRRRPYLLYPEE